MSNICNRPVTQKGEKRKRIKENDKLYLEWLREQPSAFSGIRRDVVGAHFRTSANSGVATKPLFSAIPLTNSEHMEQHLIGTFNFMPREWWQEMVAIHQRRFMAQGGVIPLDYRV